MFTRAQSTTPRTPTHDKGTSLSSVLRTIPTSGCTSGSTTTIEIPVTSNNNSDTVPIPSVSLTITAVATEVDAFGKITKTTEVPVLDTPTLTNFVLNSLEGGLHCGVPTRTTPTLTPTTLRNIEQTFLELGGLPAIPAPETHNNQAGFVPPLVQPSASASTSGGTTFISLDQKCWGGGVATLTTAPASASSSSSIISTSANHSSTSGLPRQHPLYTSGALFSNNSNDDSDTSSTGSMPSVHQNSNMMPGQPGRRMGGRRPNREDHLTPEENERRCMRRERNKMAAARCRKRRLDQTNCLQDETDDLEDKKSSLQQEIQLLQQQRDELEFLLATHKAVCRRKTTQNNNVTATTIAAPVVSAPSSINSFVTSATPAPITSRTHFINNNVTVQSLPLKEELLKDDDVVIKQEPQETQDDSVFRVLKAAAPNKPRRPTSLNVSSFAPRNSTIADLGVPIETPSAGLRGLNFESMMDGGTGLTPVTNGTGLTPLSSGLTPLTTPIVTHAPSQSSSNCSTQQRSSSDLSSPDSVVPPKLVSL